MPYSADEIADRLQLGEDAEWEFKQIEFSGNRPRAPKRNDLADEIAAFANASGGVLLCGVDDDGVAHGMTREQAAGLERLVSEVSADSIEPPVRILTHHRRLPNNQRVLLVEIPAGYSLHNGPGGNFVRAGSSKRKMIGAEALRLAQQRAQTHNLSFDEQFVGGTGFNTLEERLWKPLLSAQSMAEPQIALRKLALLWPDVSGVLRATVAGVLMCTPQPEQWLPNATITAARYRGTDRASGQIDARDITGPLPRQIHEAVAFVARNMQVGARKEPARVNLPQYSLKAVFEAIVNATVHRDYSIRVSQIRLSMFEDRLEIQSPGSLPNNLTVEDMTERQASRNPVLASVFGRMPIGDIKGSEDRQYFMERRGDGVPTIRHETHALSGKFPDYRLINNTDLRLTIPAALQEPSPARVIVTVRSAGQPVAEVKILALYPNKTWKTASTNEIGEAAIDLHSTHLPMTVFAAARGYAAHLERDWIPSDRALAVDLEAVPNGGSEIFPEATGAVPGLRGRLNPLRDTYDRTYLYASNIAINHGQTQPVHFVPGEEVCLTDADGNTVKVRILDIVGRSALVEYSSSDSA